MMKSCLLVLGAWLVAGCAGPNVGGHVERGIPDDAIGLSKVDAAAVADPIVFRNVDAEAGTTTPLPRAFHGAPPVIPHTLQDMLPITRSENMCIDCHAVAASKPGEATAIPASHYVDLRRAPDVRGTTVVKERYNCIQCHAMRTDAPPLVKNTFSR